MAEGAAVTVGQAAEELGLCQRAGPDEREAMVSGALVGDLLSHVMAHGRAGNLWITIQAHPNILAVAALGDLAAVIIADGFEPDQETVARADEEGVPLFTSGDSAYTVAGKLYALGVR